jgi:hypothetical protein
VRFSRLRELAGQHRLAAWLGVVAILASLSAVTAGTLSWAGNAALLLLAAGIGGALSVVRVPFDEAWARRLGVALLGGGGVWLFAPTLWTEGGFLGRGDWGVHHALVRTLVRGLERGEMPGWVQSVSSGDAPFEMYPAFTYLLAAGLVRLFDAPGEIMTILFALGATAHVLIAVGAARLAYRVAPWWVGWLVGLLALLDSGGYSGGGAYAILRVALLHNAVSQALFLFALVPLVDALERPTPWRLAGIWVFTALACAAHPTGLIQVAAVGGALVIAACVVRDVRAVRPLALALHLGLGAALAAVVWAPLGAKLLAYGLHYSTSPQSAWEVMARLLDARAPEHSFAAFVGVGLVGVGLGLASRRAVPTLVAGATIAMILLGTSAPYLFLELAPSFSTARLGAHRLPSLLKPFLHVAGAFALARMLAGRLPVRTGARVVAGALLAVLAVFGVRALAPLGSLRAEEVEREMRWRGPSRESFEALAAWLRAQEQPAGKIGRLLYEGRENFSYHLGGLADVPVVFTSDVPILFLRERIEDTSEESLRRFDVRWVFRWKESPRLGDPASEQRIGEFVVRRVAGWDGELARVEGGAGTVRTLALADDRIEVEVDAAAPVPVVFGMGYWPRWRAESGGRAIPVYATYATQRRDLRVVAAWLPPGKTVLTADGPLPEDGAGRVLAWGAAVVIVLGALLRRRGLRWVARAQRWLWRRRVVLAAAAAAAIAVGLAVVVALPEPRMRALEIGQGVAGRARVEARVDAEGEPFVRCEYSVIKGMYVCAGLGWVFAEMKDLVGDVPPSWRFPAPAVGFRSMHEEKPVQFVVSMRRRLAGRYKAGAAGKGDAFLDVENGPRGSVDDRREIDLADDLRSVTLSVRVSPLGEMSAGLVALDALDLDRRANVPWLPERPAF